MDKYSPEMIPDLKEQLRYDPDTGHFWWLKGRGYKPRSRPAGCTGSRGYRLIRYLFTAPYKAHVLAYAFMTGEWPPEGTSMDHINGDRDDNRWCNLRLATMSQQQWNCHAVWGRVPYKGVTIEQGKYYRAKIIHHNKRISLGHFATPEDAARAYDAKARELFGEFAKTNFA